MTKRKRPLKLVLIELLNSMQMIQLECMVLPPQQSAEIFPAWLQAMQFGVTSFENEIREFDHLASVLVKHKLFMEAASIAGCAFEVVQGMRIHSFDDLEMAKIRCYLLAKFSFAANNKGRFPEASVADAKLASALMAVHRLGGDFPVKERGLGAIFDHLVNKSCAAPRFKQLPAPLAA